MASPPFIRRYVGSHVVTALHVSAPDDVVVTGRTSIGTGGRGESRPQAAVLQFRSACAMPVPAADVLLVVDVLARSSTVSDRHYRTRRYADAGIPLYWVLDPFGERITLTEHVLAGDGVYRQEPVLTTRADLVRPWRLTLDLGGWTAFREGLRA